MNEVRSSSNRVIRFGFIGLILLITAMVLYSVKMLFLPLLASVLLTFLLQPVVNFFETRGFRRMTVIVGIYFFITAMLIIAAFFLMPRLLAEGRNIAQNLPHYESTIRDALQSVREMIIQKFPSAEIPDLYVFIRDQIRGNTMSISESIPALASSFFSVLSLIVLIPVITFFFLVDGYLIQKMFLKMVPNRYFEMFVLLFSKIAGSVQSFLRGQIIDALAVGIMTSAGLTLIGLPYSMLIGIIAGLGNLIPYLGPFIGFLPAFFILIVSPAGLTVLGFFKVVTVFVVVQFLEGTFVYPIAVGKSVNLHPLVIIIGIAVGGQLGGIIGMLIVIPIISILKVTVEVLFSYLKRYSII